MKSSTTTGYFDQHLLTLAKSASKILGSSLCYMLFFLATMLTSHLSYAASIPSNVTIDFNAAGFVESADHGSATYTQGDFTITYSAANWFQDTDDGQGGSAGLFAGAFTGVETITIQTTSGNEFDFSSFYINAFGGGFASAEGFRDAASTGTQTTGTGFDETAGAYNVTLNSTFDNVDRVVITSNSSGFFDVFDSFVLNTVPTPTITSATYNTSTGDLVVTGTTFTATGGASNDVDASDLTLTGEGGTTYTLTDTADVEITSATSFTLTLSATDSAAVNLIINKAGTSSTGGTTYNLAGAAGFIAASAAIADLTGNGITATVAAPTVTSATYDASNGALVVTGTNLKKLSGATNEIIANKFTLTGEGGSTYTLTDTANVEITSGTSFTLTLSATDRAAVNLILNKNGTSSTGATTYNLAAAEDWNAGADAAVTIADLTGNGITVSNVAAPAITSATYDASTGALVVTATGLLTSSGAGNDIVANKFTFTGQGGGTYSLTDTSNVEITSGTSFMLTLSATDKNAANLLLNQNGTSSMGGTTYNLAAAEDWNSGADAAVVIADTTGNGVTVSNAPTAPGAPTIGTATAGDGQADVTFTAPVSNGGSAITQYTATASPGGATGSCAGPAACTITVGSLTNGTAYTFTVTATNGVGTGSASAASNSVTPKAEQTITFANPGAQNFGTTPTLSATATSGLTVEFSSATTGVCTITSGGALTFVTAGTCTIDADQAGNASTNAAPTVSRSFTVNAIVPGAPTIGTATAGDTQASVTFTAPASTGGAAITGYTVTANPGGLTGTGAASPISVTGLTNGVAYTFTVTATNSAGTGSASVASNSVTPASPQTITFANPGAQNFGTSPTLTATSDSGLTVTFTSSTTGVCTVSGTTLTFVTAGTCTINADQAGDSSYLPATQVSRSFSVNAVVPGAPTIGTAIAGDTQASVAFTAPVNTGGTTITGYTVTVSPPDVAPVNGAASPVVVTGLTNGQAYTFTVTADNSAGTGPASSASNSVTPAATQTITFNNPGAQTFGTSPTLTATSDSGLTPTFTSSTPAVCTITTGGALTFVTAGTCTINADQAGNSSYLAATQVSRSFTVNAIVPGAPVIGSATAGNAEATVNFTAPASNGGSSITGYTVTASPGGISRTTTASPYVFTGLTNGTSYSFTVRATNSVGTGAASGTSNTVTPVAPNQAPEITQGASTSVNISEDGAPTAFALTLTATDADNDPLSWSISSAAENGSASVSAGVVSYTPQANYNGNDSFVVEVSDGEASDSITVNVVIAAVNDAPSISGIPGTSLDQDTSYSFVPTATDIDTNDVLTFSISNKPTWASFDPATGALTGTPAGTDTGKTLGIVISVSDGTASDALPAFDLKVIATIDPLQPIVTAPEHLVINATGLFTPMTLRQLLGLPENATQADLEAALKKLAKDGVSGNECCTVTVTGFANNGSMLLSPGRHDLVWKATNAVGVSGEAIQQLDIQPLVSLSKSQVAIRGSEVNFRVLLNGPAPQYPLSVPYVIDAATTATPAEHNLTSGVAIFTQPGQKEVEIPVSLAQGAGFSDSQLVVALDNGVNASSANQHTIEIRSGNIPPVVNLTLTQGGVNTSLVTPNGGPVTVTVQVSDANAGDTHSYDWSATSGLADTDGNSTDASRTFSAEGLAGSYQVQLNVTDSAGAVVQASVYFRVIANLPVLNPNTDTDGDGKNDEQEGTGDTDDNGIPDYLDNMPSTNILPQQVVTTNAYLIECDPGVRCGLGLFARSGSTGGVQIKDEELGQLDDLVVDPAFEPVGGVFDFAIRDLPTPGQSVRVVIPQRSAIPANAVYRKFQRGRWVTFAEDANNALHSAPGNPGYCPPPGSADWTPGLTAGYMCVQLTIEDGGANDDDGLVNSAVVDPGGVSVYFNTAPVAVNDSANTDDRTAITINVLANDQDIDQDVLTVISATAQQGTVRIEADNQLRYTPKAGFSGTDQLSYRIRDSKGGEANATVTVTVKAYQDVVVENKSSGGSSGGWMLLGLAALGGWRRRTGLLALCSAILATSQAVAADFYLQLGAGQSEASARQFDLPQGSLISTDNTDTAYQLVAGYRLLDNLAVELGYQKLGEGSATISGSVLDAAKYQQLVAQATPVLGDGVSAAIRWQFWQLNNWQFELPLGVIRWQADLSSQMAASTLTQELDGTDWFSGLTLNYQLSPAWQAGISYQRVLLEPADVNQYLLHLRYQF
ncbi:fibronectin type III domain-containing protein [Rheinheimera sp. 4Y26]|uniref:fibronectin type III domain-containing protein n=1 Tax=Rheinheimera sp. 4Y26 TaxID=2977811 RepID=UPI0021B0EAA4|nr:fibronectin type III domain-containing protein [Rheinheimera sp. 4Y26]MCT6701055.1 fibronectin type III domain-containing protein [Rheinheimera sp. 4Y26]